jgi:phage terminase large subunit-like protein
MGLRGPGAKPVKRLAIDLEAPTAVPLAGRTRAERLMNWIEGLTVPSGIHAGRPFKLRPWQKSIVREVYATDRRGKRVVRQALLSMGRKNGKTGFASALALAHLAGPEAVRGGQVLSGAADRAQAAIVYNAMKAMALVSPALADRLAFRDFRKEIEDVETGSTYQALSSDAKKAHGLSPSFWIADEVAQWRGRDLLEALRTGMGAHAEPSGWIISTRSPDPDNPLEELISYAADIDAGLAEDPAFRAFIYSAPVEADPWAPETWALANPALGDFRSLEDVRVQAEQARRIPALEAAFRAYILNQPVATDDRWISAPDWDACASKPEPSGPCFGGLDLAAGPADLSAFALYWPETGALKVWAFLPAALLDQKAREDNAEYRLWQRLGHIVEVPGRTIDRAWLGAWIVRQTEALELQSIASDRWLIDDLRTQMEREGISLPLVPHGAGFKDVSPSLTAFEAAVLEGKLRHGANPLLRWAVANVAIDPDPAGNRKPSKQRSRGRIDPAVAAIYAVGQAARQPAAPDFRFTGAVIAA